MPTILLVDDDPHIRDMVRFALQRESFKVIEAENGVSGLDLARREQPSLILLDIMMPEMDGTDMCRILRQTSRTPIIFLSSRDEEIDRILGLELGGDDYVGKPFSPRELVARVKAVLRRQAPADQEDQATELAHGHLRLDLQLYRAFWRGTEIILTATEFNILRTLVENKRKVLNRDALVDGAYGVNHFVSDRTVDSHIRRLRAKFQAVGGAPIETAQGLGYKVAAGD